MLIQFANRLVAARPSEDKSEKKPKKIIKISKLARDESDKLHASLRNRKSKTMEFATVILGGQARHKLTSL